MEQEWKQELKAYFSFSKSQTRAILFLSITLCALSLFYFLMPFIFTQDSNLPDNEFKKLMALIQADSNAEHSSNTYPAFESDTTTLHPFLFDPNTLDETGFRKLGLREKLIHTILHYRSKGGRFYNKESLQRIYGLKDLEYKQLEKFIVIEEKSASYSTEKKQLHLVELNQADTTQLIQLPGIGSALSKRILQYREQLGGFVRVEQLQEVYGISAETYTRIKPMIRVHEAPIKKLNINTATLYEINQHPYLKGELGRALVDYRKNHHYKIENLNQIKEIPLINEEIFRKIVPYISID